MTTDDTALGPTWYRFVLDPAKGNFHCDSDTGKGSLVSFLALPFASLAADSDSIEPTEDHLRSFHLTQRDPTS